MNDESKQATLLQIILAFAKFQGAPLATLDAATALRHSDLNQVLNVLDRLARALPDDSEARRQVLRTLNLI